MPGSPRTKPNPALLKFRAVVFNILRRYILGLSTQNIDTTVDLEEIKQDISSFRFEVLNLLAMPQSGQPVNPSQVANTSTGPAVSRMNQATSSSSIASQMKFPTSETSPISVKSLNDAALSGQRTPANVTRNNSVGNALLMVSPSSRLMTPSPDGSGTAESAATSPDATSLSKFVDLVFFVCFHFNILL